MLTTIHDMIEQAYARLDSGLNDENRDRQKLAENARDDLAHMVELLRSSSSEA